jgi:Tol biopolymer transport system component
VAFGGSGNEEIRVIRADGTHPRRLTAGPAYDYSPAWSPDGSHTAFARDGDIWMMAADGLGARQLTTGAGRDGEVEWSPDGLQLIFTRDDRIIIMDPNGSDEPPGPNAWIDSQLTHFRTVGSTRTDGDRTRTTAFWES